MKLYHGTAGENVKRILAHGIRPRGVTRKNNWKHSVASHPEAVYLTTAYAGYFASQAAKTKLLGILEVDTEFLDSALFRPDEDFLAQATLGHEDKLDDKLRKAMRGKDLNSRTEWFKDHVHEHAHLWQKSLDYLGTCSYVGEIPAQAITRATVFDYAKNPRMAHELLEPTITLANYRICADKYQALTEWLIGEQVAAIRLLGFPYEAVKADEAFRKLVDSIVKKYDAMLDNRAGLKLLKI